MSHDLQKKIAYTCFAINAVVFVTVFYKQYKKGKDNKDDQDNQDNIDNKDDKDNKDNIDNKDDKGKYNKDNIDNKDDKGKDENQNENENENQNVNENENEFEFSKFVEFPDLIHICFTNATNPLAYSLIFQVIGGNLFTDTPLAIHLLDQKENEKKLNGIVMEIQDCAYSSVKQILPTSNAEEAFDGCDFAFLIEPYKEDEKKNDLDHLKENAILFKTYGNAISKKVNQDFRAVVVENRAKTVLSKKFLVHPESIQDIFVWGHNSSLTKFPDFSNACYIQNGEEQKFVNSESESEQNDFVNKFNERTQLIQQKKKSPNYISIAKATCDQINDWIVNPTNKLTSVGVYSKGEYGVEKGMVFSFPCFSNGSDWNVKKKISLSNPAVNSMNLSKQELKKEWEEILKLNNNNN
ncbi:malate dehydrogenase [Anaeramoeba ignava]|uniref:Malate dehydrogenase n=1 Tax=Anaeramoeba ignava TaxID=1746090 RepID=A0A9Q0R889_ANAIG|nr:malate dehydrogenase [Anaeramoeba ignava]